MTSTKQPDYRHKPTGILYWIAMSADGFNELHPEGEGKITYASDKTLANTEIWERLHE